MPFASCLLHPNILRRLDAERKLILSYFQRHDPQRRGNIYHLKLDPRNKGVLLQEAEQAGIPLPSFSNALEYYFAPGGDTIQW